MVGHGGSSADSYLADPTSPIPSHCASIVVTSTLRVNAEVGLIACLCSWAMGLDQKFMSSNGNNSEQKESISFDWLHIISHSVITAKSNMNTWMVLNASVYLPRCYGECKTIALSGR